MGYPIMYLSEQPAPVLAPAGPGGATGHVVPAGVGSADGSTGMGTIGTNWNPPPLTRYAASGATVGSTATPPTGDDRITQANS